MDAPAFIHMQLAETPPPPHDPERDEAGRRARTSRLKGLLCISDHRNLDLAFLGYAQRSGAASSVASSVASSAASTES